MQNAVDEEGWRATHTAVSAAVDILLNTMRIGMMFHILLKALSIQAKRHGLLFQARIIELILVFK